MSDKIIIAPTVVEIMLDAYKKKCLEVERLDANATTARDRLGKIHINLDREQLEKMSLRNFFINNGVKTEQELDALEFAVLNPPQDESPCREKDTCERRG